MNKYPKISVITPSFNQGRFLEATILSVINQDYPNLEYILIDGGSTDNSLDIIKKYENKITYWISEKDSGQSHAVNKGLRVASGDILCWINSDDCLKPGTLNFVSQQFTSCAEPSWLVGSCEITDDAGKPTSCRIVHDVSISNFIRWHINWFPQQSTFWTRGMLDLVGFLDESLHYVMDYEFWWRMYTIRKPITTDKILSEYRYHDQGKCIACFENMLDEIKLVKQRFKTSHILSELIDYVTFLENKIDAIEGSRVWKIRNLIAKKVLGKALQ